MYANLKGLFAAYLLSPPKGFIIGYANIAKPFSYAAKYIQNSKTKIALLF